MKNKRELYRDKWESDLGSRRDNPLEGAGGLFALISLLGYQAVVKQISFTFSSPSPLSFPLFLLFAVLKIALDPAAPASPP